jgi:AraC-like DNA-binding protein
VGYNHNGLVSALASVSSHSPSVSLNAAARSLGVHPQTLSRAIRSETGLGFRRWMLLRRLETAKVLLRGDPTLTVSVVAARVGFASVQTFDRAFIRECQVRPTDWRRGG